MAIYCQDWLIEKVKFSESWVGHVTFFFSFSFFTGHPCLLCDQASSSNKTLSRSGLSRFLLLLTTQVLIGNREWMSLNGVAVTSKMEEQMQSFEEHGQTVVLTAVDGENLEFKQSCLDYCGEMILLDDKTMKSTSSIVVAFV